MTNGERHGAIHNSSSIISIFGNRGYHTDQLYRVLLSYLLLAFAASMARGQTAATSDTSRSRSGTDTTLSSTPLNQQTLWRRPQVNRSNADLYFTGEALRYYGSPVTLPNVFEEAGGPYPLVLGEEAYGRESFQLTPRTSESITSTLIDGVLPMNSILSGNTLTNYYSLDAFSDISLSSGAGGLSTTGVDFASSDVAKFSIERFRAPVPYSRVHYTQDLGRSTSNFDAVFSVNASPSTNLAVSIDRHASGSKPSQFDQTFNPRTDLWNVRTQMSITKYLGALPRDSTVTQHKIDSILATAAAEKNTLDFLLWGGYTTAFSGLNAGINARDSVDVFDQQRATVFDLNTYDHRIRMDALAELELPLLAEARTKLTGYASYESRRILTRDSTFPTFIPDVSVGSRMGISLNQPLTLSLGSFVNRADLQGDIQRIHKDSVFTFVPPVSDTRFSATFSDSVALRTAFRIAFFGFLRTVQSNLSIGGGPVSSLVLPSIGLAGSIGLTDALSFSASYHYAKDRATLSPSPEKTYQLQNIGAWLDLHVHVTDRDSIAIHAGVLDRNEPEGIVYDLSTDSSLMHPMFSNEKLHSQSANIALDAYFSHFHFATSATYFPSTSPVSPYTIVPSLASDLSQHFFGFAGLYFENETSEGNLRIVAGPRLRFYNRLNTQLTYDPASDYYVYRGYTPEILSSSVLPLPDPRINTPKYLIDALLSMEIDRRAQLSMSFLNLLSTPYYNVGLYPRPGFHWRLDVTWAFLD